MTKILIDKAVVIQALEAAVTVLRQALEQPAPAQPLTDEQQRIRELEAALREIHISHT